ncbi:MAG: RNA polymerase sigma factor [Phycisphaerales bacterium]|nr:RNA polymerase sigma factor [Phycisphaerales bacterium]
MTTILERIAAGERSAVDDCVREYGDLVWRLARRHLDHAPGEVEDAVQDVFVEIWMSAGRYDRERGGEAAFVATLAHRRLIDRRREHTARTRRNARAASMKPPAAGALTGALEGREVAARLVGAFDGLPAGEREALWMSVYGGLSHREIGLATESPVGTVKSRLRRAMVRLSAVVAGTGPSMASQPGVGEAAS